jgi:hypothetical protein
LIDAARLDFPLLEGVSLRRSGEGGPIGCSSGRRPFFAFRDHPRKLLGIDALVSGEPAFCGFVQSREFREIVLRPLPVALQDRNQHQPCADRSKIERRIGIARPSGVGRWWLIVGRVRLIVRCRAEWNDSFPIPSRGGVIARLAGEIAEREQGVVAPTAGEGLLDDVFEQSPVVVRQAFAIPFFGHCIDSSAIELERIRRERGQLQLAVVAQSDEAMLGDGDQLLVGVFHELPQGFDGLVPFFVGEKRFYPLQLGQRRPLDPIDLHAIGQLELPAGGHEELRRQRAGQ